MKRAFAILLCCVGFLMALCAWLEPYPARIAVNGRELSAWVLVRILGTLLAAAGSLMLLRVRRA